MPELKTLESYLVSLTMKGPSAAEQRDAEKAFKALSSAVELFVPVAAAAGGALLAITDNLAGGLSSLYYEAQRVGTTVERLKAAQYAGVQAGSSVAAISGDLKKVFDALTLTPDIKNTLKKQFGLTDEDFKDTVEVLRKIDEALNKGFHGTAAQRSEAEARRLQLGLSLENVLAAGRPQWKQAFDEQIIRGKGLNDIAVKAKDLTISLERFHAAISNVFDKAAAEIFADYGMTLDEVSNWIDANQPMLIEMAKDTVSELHKSWQDISYVGGPIVHVMKRGFDELTTTLDKLLGHPDGKHGGVYGLHYALDALAVYIAGSVMWKLVAALGIPIGRFLGPLGLAGAGAAGFLSQVPEAEGDDSYGIDHPGWHPGMPKEQTRRQKSIGSSAQDYYAREGQGPYSTEQSTSAGHDLNSPSSGTLGKRSDARNTPLQVAGSNDQDWLGSTAPAQSGDQLWPRPGETLQQYQYRQDQLMHAKPIKPGFHYPAGHERLYAGIHQNLAMLNAPSRREHGQWSRTNNIGSRRQVTNIQLASTDPHTAASEIGRHMKAIQSGTLRSLDRLA